MSSENNSQLHGLSLHPTPPHVIASAMTSEIDESNISFMTLPALLSPQPGPARPPRLQQWCGP